MTPSVRRRNARKPSASVRREFKAMLMESQGGRCAICGGEMDPNAGRFADEYPSFDHKIPHADGGTWALWNLRLAHIACNRERDRKPIALSDHSELSAA